MRKYSITKKKGEWYNAQVTDSYGNEYQNYFETEVKANNWIHYIWESEEHFKQWRENSEELLSKAIANCIEIDEKRGVEPSLD